MPDPKPEPQTQRTGPPHNPGLRKLIGAGFVAHPEGRKAGMFVLVKGR